MATYCRFISMAGPSRLGRAARRRAASRRRSARYHRMESRHFDVVLEWLLDAKPASVATRHFSRLLGISRSDVKRRILDRLAFNRQDMRHHIASQSSAAIIDHTNKNMSGEDDAARRPSGENAGKSAAEIIDLEYGRLGIENVDAICISNNSPLTKYQAPVYSSCTHAIARQAAIASSLIAVISLKIAREAD